MSIGLPEEWGPKWAHELAERLNAKPLSAWKDVVREWSPLWPEGANLTDDMEIRITLGRRDWIIVKYDNQLQRWVVEETSLG